MPLSNIQKLIGNTLDSRGDKLFAGILGLNPSKTARSPKVWNPVIQQLGLNAEYLSFDVEEQHLPALVQELKAHPNFLGCNATMPYKISLLEYVDELDATAKACGAINLVIKRAGTLIGYNVDGVGWWQSVTQGAEPFLRLPLSPGAEICLLGAGGAARAIAFQLVTHYDALGKPTIVIANRTLEKAEALVQELRKLQPGVELTADLAPPRDALLYINATTAGQAGVVAQQSGKALLETYSPLAPVEIIPFTGDAREWYTKAYSGIAMNNLAAMALLAAVPPTAKFADAIFNPPETVFLRQARMAGHATINGKTMNAWQAAEGFVEVLWEQLKGKYPSKEEAKRDVVRRMLQVP